MMEMFFKIKINDQPTKKRNSAMSKIICCWLLAMTTIGIMTVAPAHGKEGVPAGRWWRNPQVVKYLHLTDGEIGELEHAFEDSRLNLIQLKSQVEAEQFKLQNLIDKPTMDESAIKVQHRKLEAARSALAGERLNFFVLIRKIIGYDRFQQLLALRPAGKR
jgi:Spy/CpxP family protein refolding chaperone